MGTIKNNAFSNIPHQGELIPPYKIYIGKKMYNTIEGDAFTDVELTQSCL